MCLPERQLAPIYFIESYPQLIHRQTVCPEMSNPQPESDPRCLNAGGLVPILPNKIYLIK
jgi:hypothetical protein